MQSMLPQLSLRASDLNVRTLGARTFPSPLGLSTVRGDEVADYVPDDARITWQIETRAGARLETPILFEKAGPRETIFFDPKDTRVGIVTCGGLCPGINNVIRSIVLELTHKYRVQSVLGFRYGYRGLDPAAGTPPVLLTPAEVVHVHRRGGSFLGTRAASATPRPWSTPSSATASTSSSPSAATARCAAPTPCTRRSPGAASGSR